MRIKTAILLALLNAFIIGTCAGATAEQAGTYEGTIQTKITNVDGTKSKQKATLKIEIALDNVTTITINGTAKEIVNAGYGPTGGIMIFGDVSTTPQSSSLATVQISEGKLKGTAVGSSILVLPGELVLVSTTQSKLKAKKIP
jgi:hypothetical protein